MALLGTAALVATVLAAWRPHAAWGRPGDSWGGPECGADNPTLATSRFVRGTSFGNEAAVIAFRRAPEGGAIQPLALVRQVGAVYGLAFDPARHLLFAGAFHKRNSAFGPLGTGGLYAIDVRDGSVERFARVPGAGNDMHHREDDYEPDERGRSFAGKSALGDIDLSEDGRWLFAVNLADRKIHRLSAADGSEAGQFPHGAAAEPWADDARPFALDTWRGWLFHGVTRTAQTSQDPDDLFAQVYASRLDGTEMQLVAEVALGYDRGRHEKWGPWPRRDDDDWQRVQHPQPELADIELDASGAMILGLRDRYIDTGPGLTEMYRVAPGDILRLDAVGELRWALADPAVEHYAHDDLAGWHDEIAIGGLAVLPERDVVVTTAIDPLRTHSLGARLVGSISAGALWLDNPTGADLGREELMYNSLRHEGPFGKANGLGDMEVLCAAPTATPTPAPPSPSPGATATATRPATGTATASPSPSPTPSASATWPPERHTIYLPAADRQPACREAARPVDVVLVLDRSTSMLRPAADGLLPKNEAAIGAARTFVGLLRMDAGPDSERDRVAVVGFNDLAWTEEPLTGDRMRALLALERLETRTAEGTRLDLALVEGQAALDAGPPRPDALAVLVLLTDGLPNRVPTPAAGGTQADTVAAHARRVKERGTRIFTVGLGQTEDVLGPLLGEVASSPDMCYLAPTGEDLDDIYRRIAGTILRCPPDPPAAGLLRVRTAPPTRP